MFKDTGTGKKTPWGAGTHTGHTDKRSTNLTTIPSSKFPTHQRTPRARATASRLNQAISGRLGLQHRLGLLSSL